MAVGLFAASALQTPAQAPAGPPSEGPGPAAGVAAPGGQGPAAAAGRGGRGGAAGGGGGGLGAYPMHPQADADTIARGQQIYMANCASCHGADARGGQGGINLVRSQLVMDDDKGELIAPVVQNGRVDNGMPKFDLTDAQVTDLAGYIHKVGASYRTVVSAPTNIVVGDAAAGEAYFNGTVGKCSSCHSVTGDLAGIGSRMDAKAIQNALVSGSGGGRGRGAAPAQGGPARRVTSVTVTMTDGKVLTGTLVHLDDFLVTLTEADGTRRSIDRNADVAKVDVTNPLQAHIDLLPKYTDDDIHNLTAYLVTVK